MRLRKFLKVLSPLLLAMVVNVEAMRSQDDGTWALILLFVDEHHFDEKILVQIFSIVLATNPDNDVPQCLKLAER